MTPIFYDINSNGTRSSTIYRDFKKVKNSALRYFYLNAEKNASLGSAGTYAANSLIYFIILIPVQLK